MIAAPAYCCGLRKKPQIAVGLVNDCGINGWMWEL